MKFVLENNKLRFREETEKLKDIYELNSNNLDCQTKWKLFQKKFLIDESGKFMGINVIDSTKKDVIYLMSEFSNKFTSIMDQGNLYIYSDIGVSFLFDYQKKVKEITFLPNYQGRTLNGIKIGDNYENLISIYKNIRENTNNCYIWNHLCFFIDKKHPGKIKFMRLQRYNY